MVRITMVLILAILSVEPLASPLNLDLSIKGVQNSNTTEQSAESVRCLKEGDEYCCDPEKRSLINFNLKRP